MVKDLKYIIKRVLIGVGIALLLMTIKNGGLVLQAHAMTIKFYNTNTNGNNVCATCSTIGCNYRGTGNCANINRVSVVHDSYVLQNTLKYNLYTTINLTIDKSYCTSGNLGLRDGYYTGNFAGNSWNDASTITWNNIDDLNVEVGGVNNGMCVYTWGLVQQFTSKINSQGMTFDFYFSTPQPLRGVYVKRYELVNQSTSGSSQADTINAINNSANAVINSQANNTTNIINNQNENANKINDTMKDETAPTDEEITYLFDFDLDDSNSPVSDLITMPITLLQAYLNGFNSSCSSVSLGSLYGHNIVLPCIRPQDYLGSTLWNLIDMCFALYLVYNVGLMCVSIYESITSLDDNFQSLYTPKHAQSEYQPKHGGGN